MERLPANTRAWQRSLFRRILARRHSGSLSIARRDRPALGGGLGCCIQKFKGHSKSVNSVAFSPDGTQVASASHDGRAIGSSYD